MFPITIVERVLYYSDMYIYQSCAIPEIVKKFYKRFFSPSFVFLSFLDYGHFEDVLQSHV